MTTRAVLVGLVVTAMAAAGCAPPAISEDASLRTLEVKRHEGWLQGELRRFRTYPHLDRAFRLMSGGALPAAAAELERYLVLDAADVKVRFHYLTLLHRLGEHERVIREADIVLRHEPAFPTARLYRALALRARGDDVSALRDAGTVAETADAASGVRAIALGLVADLALQHGDAPVALRAAEGLVAVEPGPASTLRRGRALEAVGRLDDANAAFTLALAQADTDERRTQAHEALAALAERRRDWTSASRELRSLLDHDPRNPSILRRLAEVGYARGALHDAARWFAAAAAVSSSARDAERAGHALYATADYRAGIRAFRRLAGEATTAPDRHRILLALGHGYVKLRDFEEAARAFGEAAALKRDVPTVTALADALERSGRSLEAISALETVAAQDPSGQTHLAAATLYARLRRWEPALEHLARAIGGEATPKVRAEAHKQQGFIHYARGQYREARAAFEWSIRDEPDDLGVYMALGETCMKLDAPEDAVRYLKRALTLTERRQPS